MKRVGLVPHWGKTSALQLTSRLRRDLEIHGCSVWVESCAAVKLGLSQVENYDLKDAPQSDFIIVLGGDGTLLSTARALAPKGIPILGVNLGHLGFLTELEVDELEANLPRLLSGKYELDSRLMLEARVVGPGGEIRDRRLALNDIVLTRGVFARIIQVQVAVNNCPTSSYKADGIIISTPTGSTAYSLSAGGPIVHPQLETILITPICPHSLASRSLLIKSDEVIRLTTPATSDEVMLTVDGQCGFRLQPLDAVEIARSPHRARLVRLTGRGFYQVLNSRFSRLEATLQEVRSDEG